MFKNNENISDLEYVLQFALHTVKENELENETSSENWKLGESIEAELSKLLFTSSNSDLAKCLDDLYENYPCRDEWDKADIAELLKKHFA